MSAGRGWPFLGLRPAITRDEKDMTIRVPRQVVVVAMAACLLLVSVLAAPATVAHELQHAHHKAPTHSSPLCSWLCGVGQGLGLDGSLYIPILSLLALLMLSSLSRNEHTALLSSHPRGPPAAYQN